MSALPGYLVFVASNEVVHISMSRTRRQSIFCSARTLLLLTSRRRQSLRWACTVSAFAYCSSRAITRSSWRLTSQPTGPTERQRLSTMRLINAKYLTIHEFFGSAIPPYAILSHRWEGHEVTFQEVQSNTDRSLPLFSKIRGCCAQAVSDGWEWAWIDSCCIDKMSSAELSEAINSMFRWYREAQACYAYLSDVPGGGDWEIRQRQDSAFRNSQWFTRGWTLQELLAPDSVIFFDQSWEDIGTRSSMEDLLSDITGIDYFEHYENASIAQKMSWASPRKDKRPEKKTKLIA